MRQDKKITVLIPCHNEEKGIGKVLRGIPYRFLNGLGYSVEAIVIDNNSTDNTRKIAEERKVRVIHEPKRGKGNAIRAGFRAVSEDTKYVVMLDGDNTYKAKEMTRLLEPLMTNFCDVTIGSRLGGKMKENSFTIQNRMVNWIYTFLVRQIYHANTTDVLSGYFAWKKEVVDDLLNHIESYGFAVEMEMVIKLVKLNYQIYSVPITYGEREGHSKIDKIPDGLRIMKAFVSNLFWGPKVGKKIKETIKTQPRSQITNN